MEIIQTKLPLDLYFIHVINEMDLDPVLIRSAVASSETECGWRFGDVTQTGGSKTVNFFPSMINSITLEHRRFFLYIKLVS